MDDILNQCRICTEVANPPISLLDPVYQQFNTEITDLLSLVIDPSNGLPTVICAECLKISNKWLALKFTCALSQKYFISIVEENASKNYNLCLENTTVFVNNPENAEQMSTESLETFNGESINMSETIDVSHIKFESTEVTELSSVSHIPNISDCIAFTKVPEIVNTEKNIYDVAGCSKNVHSETSSPNILVQTSESQAKNNCDAQISKPKKKELRVMLERIDVKKYMSELSTKKTVVNENLVKSNLGQFVLDAENEPKTCISASNMKILDNIQSLLLEMKKGPLCDICNKRFPSLLHHYEKVHQNLPPSQLTKSLNRAEELRRTCPICKYVMTQSQNVKIHLLTHIDPSLYSSIKYKSVPALHTHTGSKYSFSCSICSKTFLFKSLYNLKKHILSHATNAKPKLSANEKFSGHETDSLCKNMSSQSQLNHTELTVQCKYCLEKFHLLRELNKHLKLKHQSCYTCFFCKMTFETKSKLTKHIKDHMNAHQKSECDGNENLNSVVLVDETITRSSTFIENNKELVYRSGKLCEICNQRFVYLRKHFLRVHYNIPTSKREMMLKKAELVSRTCPICKFVLKHLCQLKSHMSAHFNFCCKYCSCNFQTSELLNSHLIRTHKKLDQILFSCPTCNKSFAFKSSLTEHMKSHINNQDDVPKLGQFEYVDVIEEPEIETNESISIPTIEAHAKEMDIINLTLKTLKEGRLCEICNKRYPLLRNHFMTDHKNIPLSEREAMYTKADLIHRTCPMCKFVLKNSYQLKSHILIHGQPSFLCDYCPLMMKTASNMRSHIKTKHPEAKQNILSCSTCNKTFKFKSSLAHHIKSHINYDDVIGPKLGQFEYVDVIEEPQIEINKSILNVPTIETHATKIDIIRPEIEINKSKNVPTIETHATKIDIIRPEIEINKSKNVPTIETHAKDIIRPEIEIYKSISVPTIEARAEEMDIISLSLETVKEGRLCEICNKRYPLLRNHFTTDHKNIPLSEIEAMVKKADLISRTCPICKFVLKNLCHVKNHILTHSKPTFLCEYCPLMFKSASNMRCHIKHKHTEPDQKLFSCSTCNRSYAVKSSLIEHMKSHIHYQNVEPKLGNVEPKLGHFEYVNIIEEPKIEINDESSVPLESNENNSGKLCEICNERFLNLRNHVISVHQTLTTSEMTDMLQKAEVVERTCQICKLVTRDALHMETHLLSHRTIQCNICLSFLNSAESLKRHIELKHMTVLFSCYKCNKTFQEKTLLLTHLKTHMDVPSTELLTEKTECVNQEVIKSQIITNDNISIQNNVKISLACEICNVKFEMFPFLAKHLRTIHTNLTNSQIELMLKKAEILQRTCPICKFVFTSAQHTEAHLKTHSESLTKLKDSPTTSAFQKYIVYYQPQQTNSELFSCSSCNKNFVYKSSLRKHIIEHLNEESQFEYDSNNEIDQDDDLLENENNSIHDLFKSRQSCDICNESYSNLRIHLQYRHDVTITQANQMCQKADMLKRTCPICKIVLTRSVNLSTHIIQHSPWPEFKCGVCFRKFRSFSSVYRHVRSKHPELKKKSFCCRYCCKSFKSFYLLSIHERKHYLRLASQILFKYEEEEEKLKETESIMAEEIKSEITVDEMDWNNLPNQDDEIVSQPILQSLLQFKDQPSTSFQQ